MEKSEVKIGAVLSYIIIILNVIVGLIYTPILIRTLGQSEYGLYSLVVSIISYLTLFDFGFGNTIIIYTTRYRTKGEKENEQKLHGMFFLIYILIGIIAGIAGTILYSNTNNMFHNTMTVTEIQTAKILMKILILNLVITFPLSMFSSIITAYEKFIFAKVLNIIRIILIPVVMVPLLYMGYKSITLAIITTVFNIAILIINTIFCICKLKIKIKFGKLDTKVIKEIFAYSFYIFLGTIIDKANWSIDQFILGSVAGTVAVAIYSVSAQLNSMYLNFSTAISGVLLPKVTKMEENNASNEEFSDMFIKTGRLQFIILALIISGFILFGQEFINLWAGTDYSQAFIIACILMIPATIPLIQNVGLNILQAKNKYKYRTVVLFAVAILNVIISIPLAKVIGGIGSAIGTAIALIVGNIIFMNIYYYKKIHLDIPKFWKEISKMAIPIIIITAIFYFIIDNIMFNIVIYMHEILIYILIYIFTVWNFSMNEYEKDILGKPFKKILMRGKNI